MLIVIFLTFSLSILFTSVIILTNKFHSSLTSDNELNAIQKYHKIPVPRIGGLPIFMSFIVSSFFCFSYSTVCSYYLMGLTLCGLIIFIGGFIDDITKNTPPFLRMLFAAVATLVAIYSTNSFPVIQYAGVNWLNYLIKAIPAIGVLLSLFCVVGLTNAYNIIDGYHGLSSTAAIFNLIGLSALSIITNDQFVLNAALSLAGAICGFLLFNYPKGKIFLGDGGAYIIGFLIAALSIYLTQNHSDILSPYSVLFLSCYPVTELGLSIYRRKFLKRKAGMKPDRMHLHQLIYHRCLSIAKVRRNCSVMPTMLFFMLPQTILAIVFYNNTSMCLLLNILYIILYTITYFRIVRFKTFKFLNMF
ncbi:MAG TPA: MraY family glycosyltransferase [Burkholderiales bacterium]|nr:MraY family glycosyltransferase [Burkholderiales bacterium]